MEHHPLKGSMHLLVLWDPREWTTLNVDLSVILKSRVCSPFPVALVNRLASEAFL